MFQTRCRRAATTICLRPMQVDNIFIFIRQVAVLFGITISSYLFARWHLFRHVGYLGHRQQVNLWPFDLESGVWVTCDVDYLCANFSLPRPLCTRVRPDVRDRQTDRQTDRHQTTASLNASALWGQRDNKWLTLSFFCLTVMTNTTTSRPKPMNTRSSANADKRTRAMCLEVSQGHQTWYHSTCQV